MKILNCVRCHDLVKVQGEWRSCACGASSARYLEDGRGAEVSGHGRLLGLDGRTYGKSLERTGVTMELFVIADSDPRIRRIRRRWRPGPEGRSHGAGREIASHAEGQERPFKEGF